MHMPWSIPVSEEIFMTVHVFKCPTTVNIDWDVDRYADKVKLSPPNLDGTPSAEPERLKKFFPETILGRISVPTTVVDRHGKILVVYLPNILTPSRIVCFRLGISF